jgi:membrane protein
MSVVRRLRSATKDANIPAILAGAVLGATYAVALSRGRRPGFDIPAGAETLPPARRLTGWARWKHILYRTYQQINDDRLLALAAGVVFYGLLALFPAVTALVSSYALFANTATINDHLAQIASLMPASAFTIVSEQVTRIVTRGTGDLSATFFIGLALAVWSANAGVKAVIDALNIVYGVNEARSFIRLNLISLAFTVGAIAGLLLAIAAIVVLPIALSYLHVGRFGDLALAWLRWPALFVMLLVGLAVRYRFGPNRPHARWQWISPGAVFAALAWIAGSALLSWYLGNFADYDATYGSLGAGIGLMMWLWMTAIVVLVGAELNSEIDAVDGSAESPPAF